MEVGRFNRIVEDTLNKCKAILWSKNDNRSINRDRLGNFKKAAIMQGITPKQALFGMKAKHTVTLNHMIMGDLDAPLNDLEEWDKLILDEINYLILLRAMLIEELIINAEEAIKDGD